LAARLQKILILGVIMTIETKAIALSTRGNADMVDITTEVADAVRDTGLSAGTVTVFCPSATSALTTIEFESGCLSDLERLFDEITARDRHYAHNARWGDGNGHSHVRAALLGPSLTIPFVDGALTLGTWQQIIFVDFDNRARQRRLVAQVMGE
jgi:secondary thiamine-phosphate synthase enzyme